MSVFEVKKGISPLILGIPHSGTFVPEEVKNDLNENGLILADTDWHIHKLYDGLIDDATVVRALFHRYVIDANRDPEGVSLYPGQNTTTLVPLTDFDGLPIWNKEPDFAVINQRKQQYHKPYHAALKAEIERVKAIHGYAILYDCHSIRSCIPYLFDGKLPDFNVGTNDGTTALKAIEQTIINVLEKAEHYSFVFNGRFKGGWTTRHYADPANKVFVIQMELAQYTYLATEDVPFAYDENKAATLRIELKKILGDILQAV